MTGLLTFEYCSVHGALAAAYTSGALAAEFGPDRVRVTLPDASAGRPVPLLSELPLAEAATRRHDTRLLGLVPDGDGPAWALLTTPHTLERDQPLLVRALSAVLLARPHRRPLLGPADPDPAWLADGPLRAASIMVIEDFVSGGANLAA
jgi:hypothetical protein